jgi:hypothetical protein
VAIHHVLEAGVASRVGARHPLELELRRVRVDDLRPDHERALLRERHLVVVRADELAPLGDDEMPTGRCVVDIFLKPGRGFALEGLN